eukprot:gene18811-25356_t
MQEGGATYFSKSSGPPEDRDLPEPRTPEALAKRSSELHGARGVSRPGLRVHPKKGRAAVFWSALPDGSEDLCSLHAAEPVTTEVPSSARILSRMDDEQLKQHIDVLPDELRAYVLALPKEKQAEVVKKIVQTTALSFQQLDEEDIATIKNSGTYVASHEQERTAENGAYGFIIDDMHISWDELNNDSYICLGAFEERSEDEVPVAFIIAQLSRLDQTKELYLDDGEPSPGPESTTQGGVASGNSPSSSQGHSTQTGNGTAPVPDSGSEDRSGTDVYSLLQGTGYQPTDVVLSVYFLGVDFEFRRQGFGRQLLGLVQSVAEAKANGPDWKGRPQLYHGVPPRASPPNPTRGRFRQGEEEQTRWFSQIEEDWGQQWQGLWQTPSDGLKPKLKASSSSSHDLKPKLKFKKS